MINDNGEFRLPPDETSSPPAEYNVPPEYYEPAPGQKDEKKKKKKKSSFFNMLRTQAIMPVAAAIASVSVISSALGANFFTAIGIDISRSRTVEKADSYIMAEYQMPSSSGYYDGTNVVSVLVYAEDGIEVTNSRGETVGKGSVDGVTFDESTNTLTLDDAFCELISISGMGNITVSVKGQSTNVGTIEAKGGGEECGITFVPCNPAENPAITLSARDHGDPCVFVDAGGSASRVVFGDGLSVFLYAKNAVVVEGTTVSDAVVTEKSLSVKNAKLKKSPDSGLYDIVLELTAGEDDPVIIETK